MVRRYVLSSNHARDSKTGPSRAVLLEGAKVKLSPQVCGIDRFWHLFVAAIIKLQQFVISLPSKQSSYSATARPVVSTGCNKQACTRGTL